MVRAILLAVGAVVVSLGGGEAVPTSPGAETQAKASGQKAIVIEWVGGPETITYMVEIRNAGATMVDVSGFSLSSSPTACPADGRLEVIRGSLELTPGAKALVLTHSDVPTDDLLRKEYPNLYLAVENGRFPTLPLASVILVDAVGAPVTSAPIGLDAGTGICCRPATGEQCTLQTCGTESPNCITQVTKAYCCNTLLWCAWRQSSATHCVTQSCFGTGYQCCN